MQINRILIIDDEKNVRENLKRVLELEGYEVELAINGEDGLSKFSSDNFPVVLLDMKLPGIDGIEVLKQILQKNDRTKVIMITGYGTIETAVETMKLGAVDFLRKPFSPEEIREAVKDVINRLKMEQEERELNSFTDFFNFAKSFINKRDFKKAVEYLEKAISMDSSKPEPYNLLGVIYEMEGEMDKARKMYRAALAIDPSYKPADENLERVIQFNYSPGEYNLGDEDDDEDK